MGALHNYSNITMLGSLTFPYLMGNAHVSGVPEPYNATCVEDCCFDCDTWETKLNDVWGWTSADGRQIAVAGTPDRTVIVDVTNGSDPRQLGFLPQITSNVAIWKDVKVWESTVFIGSESKGFGIQVLDLQKVVDAEDVPRVFLPDQVFYNDSAFHSHNLVINDNAPILYTVDTNLCNTLARIPFTITSDGEVVLETDIPDASCIGGEITEVHDAQCVIYNGPDQRFLGKEICFLSTGYQASVAIYSWTTDTVLGHLNYTDAKFSHQSWLTEDSAYMFHGDELDVGNTRTSIFDVRDLTNITELAPYIAPTNFVDHNQYVVGRLVYQANYAGGLVILAHDNQGNAERVGYYDYSWVEQDQMMGAWGVYPFFSSGEFAAGKKIVLTGYEGLQVFEIDEELECYLDDTCMEPSYECGETMEECNMAYQTSQADLDAALSVTCNPTPAPTAAPSLWQSTMSMYTTADLTDPLSNWMFNQMNNNAQIQEDFGLNDGNTLAVIGNQYVVVSGDYVYPTCVQHGAAGDAADPTLVTLTGTTAGQASEQRSALYLAADRNDFKHEDCPDLEGVCTKLSGFFMDMLADRGRVPETIAENLCVDSMGSLMYVTQDAYKHICVGHGGSADSIELCPMSNTDIYFCGGINGGLGTWGYPGQQMGAVEQAYSYATNDGNGPFDAYMFMHPQCRNY